MEYVLILAWLTIVAIVAFDFTNGFHDSSNMLSTLVASRAMTPAQSVLLVGTFTLLGPLLGGTAVANTLGGIVSIEDLQADLSLRLLLCGVCGAICWNLLTWWRGLPSSSSHALIGGIAAVVVAGSGVERVFWGFSELMQGRLVGVTKVLLTLLTSPLLGFIAGYLLQYISRLLLRAASPRINRPLRRGQWITAAALAFSHGTNDAQKGMGIITLVLVLSGQLESFAVPFWVMLVSSMTMTLGTTLGGWRIVRTVGYGIYRLRPLHGLNVQLGAASVIFGASLIGGPVSTTHVVSTCIMGVGASERPKAVRWLRAREIALAWLLTLPGAGLLALLIWWLSLPLFGAADVGG